ncbi:hypothetical protein [Pseudoalteromonas sp.]|uniref:hypothetical protein n=1 Tax=Pseudoalteromonas sp. TaxID=53249 RepID=UPI0035687DFC
MKNQLYSLCCILLVACGGTSNEQTAMPAPVSVKSNKLIDNPVSDNANFAQFKQHHVEIDLQSITLNGNNIYIKVYVNTEQTLFLGKVPAQRVFSIHVPNNIKTIKYDIFSDFSDDQQVTGEISL